MRGDGRDNVSDVGRNAEDAKQKSHNKELIKVIDHLNNRLKIITKNEYNLKIKLKIAEEACTVLCSV